MPSDDLQRMTKDAPAKTHFVIIDAVGVTESGMSESPPMERKRSVKFARLLEEVAWGKTDPATISSLAFRLASDIDHHVQRAQEIHGLTSGEMPDDAQIATAREEMAPERIRPTQTNVDLRNAVIDI